MSNELTRIKPTGTITVSKKLASIFGGIKPNIPVAESLPTLSFSGKTWKVNIDNTETVVMDPNREDEPATQTRIVVLGVNAPRSRAYHAGTYDPDSPSAPVCWSYDGVEPDASIAVPQARTCAECKWSAKGSKINDQGKAVMACQQNKRLAVVPAADTRFTPLLLKLPITSIYDATNPYEEKGWYAWDQYLKNINARVKREDKLPPHTAMFVTAVRFDPNVVYPKLLFKLESFVEDDQEMLDGIAWQLSQNKDKIDRILGIPTIRGQVSKPQPEPVKTIAPLEDELEPEPVPPKKEKVVQIKPKKAKKEEIEEPEDDLPPVQVIEEGQISNLDSLLNEPW